MHNKTILLSCVSDILMEQTDEVIIADILKYILRTYSRMRGKDLVRRIMGKKSRSLNLHTRQKVAAASDPSWFKFKKDLDKETDAEEDADEISDHTELLDALESVDGNNTNEDECDDDDPN